MNIDRMEYFTGVSLDYNIFHQNQIDVIITDKSCIDKTSYICDYGSKK